MCGISGFLDLSPSRPGSMMERIARNMSDAIAYRGPDADDVWVDESSGVALSHCRLAIVDLTEAGAQPMTSKCGRLVIVYNGEIYNAPELREELSAKGHAFVGHSDTEVLVAACVEWGVTAALKRMIGMFAFALWDRRERTLTLARDRLGIKPLYWSHQNNIILFGSELKALQAHDDWSANIDRNALTSYLRLGYVPAPLSIFSGVQKLEPGTVATFTTDGRTQMDSFWSMPDVVAAGRNDPFTGTGDEAVSALRALLGDAVKRRMISDVPLGAFLSGGIDSTAIAALMQENSETPVKTFTIGFDEEGFDEAVHAKAVAAHLGTDHTELYVQPGDARAVIPRLPYMYDEPFADSSQIPTFLVSEMTRRDVTVVLSGDGGDELFGGYNRYRQGARLAPLFRNVPRSIRCAGSALLESLSPESWDVLCRALPNRWRHPQMGDKIHKLADVLRVSNEDLFYRRLVAQHHYPERLVRNGHEPGDDVWHGAARRITPDFNDRMQFLDTVTYLPDDILCKVDRASMAVSLEARVPMLDHRVVEFAWRLPQSLRSRAPKSKWMLRQLLRHYVPDSLVDRPKMGFSIPLAQWMRNELKDWVESLIEPGRLESEGYLKAEPIREMWTEHLMGTRNRHYALWPVLMFQAWLEPQQALIVRKDSSAA